MDFGKGKEERLMVGIEVTGAGLTVAIAMEASSRCSRGLEKKEDIESCNRASHVLNAAFTFLDGSWNWWRRGKMSAYKRRNKALAKFLASC
jgi:hypothetical protein